MISHTSRTPFVQARDGTRLYTQDWGTGRPIVFLSAWAFTSAVWGEYIAALTPLGHRCIAFDRRGHGRSDAPNAGYDADTLADDVAAVLEQTDVRDAVLVGYSMGSIEAVRYLSRHGTSRIGKLVLIAPTTPFLTQTADNPDGVPAAAIEAQDAEAAGDFAKWIADNEPLFVTSDTIAETRAWLKAMMLEVLVPVAMSCRKMVATTDTRAELAHLDLPTLILHGDNDVSAPLPLTGAKTATLVRDSRLVVYEGAPHGMVVTHRRRVLADIAAYASAKTP